MSTLTEIAAREAENVLRRNIVERGGRMAFVAMPELAGNYFAVWTRDAVSTLAGAILTDDERLRKASTDSLDFIRDYQAENGRIPAYVDLSDPERPKTEVTGWGRIETLDSQMWHVIGSRIMFEQTGDEKYIKAASLDSYGRSLSILDARASASDPHRMVVWPVSAGWDDQMLRDHHVTSLESLRIMAIDSFAKMLEAAGKGAEAQSYRRQAENLREQVNESLWLTPDNIGQLLAKDTPGFGVGYFSAFPENVIAAVNESPPQFFQSFMAPYVISKDHVGRFDAYANVLAVLAGIPDAERTESILRQINDRGVNKPFPVRVLDPVIGEGNRDYHPFLHAQKNKPHHYHNGGIWPHITGLFIESLVKSGRPEEAATALEQLAEMVRQPGSKTAEWGFNEYYLGSDGSPAGNDNQAWGAGGLLYANHAVSAGKAVFGA